MSTEALKEHGRRQEQIKMELIKLLKEYDGSDTASLEAARNMITVVESTKSLGFMMSLPVELWVKMATNQITGEENKEAAKRIFTGSITTTITAFVDGDTIEELTRNKKSFLEAHPGCKPLTAKDEALILFENIKKTPPEVINATLKVSQEMQKIAEEGTARIAALLGESLDKARETIDECIDGESDYLRALKGDDKHERPKTRKHHEEVTILRQARAGGSSAARDVDSRPAAGGGGAGGGSDSRPAASPRT